MLAPLFLLILAFLPITAQAQTWNVTYYVASPNPGDGGFFGAGSYLFLNRPDFIPVYLQENNTWNFLGMYGAPYQQFAQAAVPSSMPQIAFAGNYDGAVAVPVVGTPELAVLRRLPRHIYGPQINAAVTPVLQRVTAWTTAKLLHAKSQGEFVYLPSVTLEVLAVCSGLITMKWFALLGLLLAVTSRASIPWRVALLVVAPAVAFEVNVLRIAAAGIGYEAGWGLSLKEVAAWPMLAFGLAQVLCLGRWVNRA